ncbi:MDR family MFS transporter [Clostridium felsineum]|uniref:MDR family MFS transporter n=1 Tax=Clostridium felsineum TaxID=36839 RepID=UPI00098C5A41|nr:MDR family MFS transporter [Clostridium felsineum]URZ03173.1 Putative multidrug resistance protein MdtD [Clostridium felsineum]
MQAKQLNSQNTPKYNVKAIMITLLLAGFLSLFNETILNVAFPTLMKEMHVSAITVQWLITANVLVVGILVPVTAFLLHTFTTKQLYLASITFLLLGTVCAIFSTSFTALLISRIIQAFGTGLIVPLMMNSSLAITPPEKHGSIMGLCVSILTLGPALGPTASGILLQYFSWHSLFIVLVPLLILCIILGIVFLENTSEITKPKIDYLSIILSTIAFAGIIYSISSLSTSKLSTSLIILAVGIIALIIYVKRQLTLSTPILELRPFKNPVFTVGVLLIAFVQSFQFSANVILPTLLQDGLKTSTFTSALVLLPAILVSAICTPFVGKVFDKIGGKVLIPLGFAIICGFTFVLSRVSLTTSVLSITLLYCCIMFGQSLTMSTSQTTSLSVLENKTRADGVAIVNTAMQLAGALGSSVYVGLMTAFQTKYLNSHSGKSTEALYNGFNHAIFIAAIVLFIGFLFSLYLSSKSKKAN